MFVQIWCQNFLANWKFLRGVLLHLSKSGVGIFWPKFFLAGQKFHWGYFYICPNLVSEFFSQSFFSASWKFWRGGTFTFVQIWGQNFLAKNFRGGTVTFLQKWPQNFFPTLGGYQNMKTSECLETSRYAKIFDLGAFFVDHFGPQSSGWGKFGCHFDPVTPIAQGPDFYWSFIFCPSLAVPNLVLISWMM